MALVGKTSESAGLRLEGSLVTQSGTLFSEFALDVKPNRWTCLLGASGVGKTTILRLFAGLDVHGRFDGQLIRPDHVSYMAQTDLLLPWLDILGNVTLGAKLRNEPVETQRAQETIQRVGLSEHIHKLPSELSGGMRQRAALARTLMEDADTILLDEPFSALDARTRAEMQALAFELFSGRTVLLVTHDPAEAARLGKDIFVMRRNGISRFSESTSKPLRGHHAPEKLELEARLFEALDAGRAA
jgi:putative hydroxymethylpyrimidine transport system ATP-binding protein